MAVEPIVARASCKDKDEVRAFGLQATDEVVDVTLSRPDVAEGDDLGVVVLGSISDRDGFFMDIQPDLERARLVHG
jgi:hypothetical protein